MRIILLFLFVLFAHYTSIAQCDGLEGGFLFGAGTETGHTISVAQNGDYLLAGVTDSYGPGMDDWLIIRTDQALQPIWSKAIGFSNSDEGGVDVILHELSNGMIVTTGYQIYNGRQGIVMLLNGDGEIQWTRKITGNSISPREVLETPDGGFIICGSYNITGSNSDDAMLMKFNLTGDVLWQKRFDAGPGKNDHFLSLVYGSNGNIFIAGGNEYLNGNQTGHIVEMDINGNIIDQKLYNNNTRVVFHKIISAPDGSFIVGANQSTNQEWYGCILKIESDMSISWARKIRQGNKSYVPYVDFDNNGNVLAGLSNHWNNGVKNIAVATLDYNTGEIISLINPTSEASHASRPNSRNFVRSTAGELLGAGTKDGKFSVIAFNECTEFSCSEEGDYFTEIPVFNVVDYDRALLSINPPVNVFPEIYDIQDITIGNFCNTCSASPNVEDYTGCEGEPVIYSVDMQGVDPDDIVSVVWNFGNGENSSLLNPELIYDEEGIWDFTVEIITNEECEYNLEGTTEIFAMPTPAEIPSTITLCAGDTYELELDQSLGWDEILDPQGNPIDEFVFTSEGTYTFSFNSPCISTTETIEVYQINNTELLGTISSPACIETELEIIINDWEEIAEFAIVDLDFGNGSSISVDQNISTTQYMEAGEYEVLLTGEIQGCDVYDSAVILIEAPLVFETQTEYTICEGEKVSIDLSAFQFDIQNSLGQIIENFETGEEGSYEFSATNSCGTANQTVTINVNSYNPAPFGTSVALCPAKDTITIGFENHDYNFEWSSGDTTSTINVSAGGVYLATVNNAVGCSNTFSFVINEIEPVQRVIFEDPVINVCEEGSHILSLPYYGYPYTFPDSSKGYSFKIEESGPFLISYTDNCYTYYDEVEILIEPCLCPVYIPNAFTPDMDDVNDVFKAITNCPLIDFNMAIYNRFGEKVFESNDVDRGWNGHSKNNSYHNSNDLYIYRVRYTQSLEGLHYPTELKGQITLIR